MFRRGAISLSSKTIALYDDGVSTRPVLDIGDRSSLRSTLGYAGWVRRMSQDKQEYENGI